MQLTALYCPWLYLREWWSDKVSNYENNETYWGRWLAPFSQTLGSIQRTPWPTKPAGKMIWPQDSSCHIKIVEGNSSCTTFKWWVMDKLQLVGQTFGRVFNSRFGGPGKSTALLSSFRNGLSAFRFLPAFCPNVTLVCYQQAGRGQKAGGKRKVHWH